jgi:hypothetical protein
MAEQIICDSCAYYSYDEDWGGYVCDISMDEDEWQRFISEKCRNCPYYVSGDEYELARKQ